MMHRPKSVQENVTHKLLCDVNGSSNLGQTSRPSDSLNKKKENLPNSGLCRPG